MLMYISVPPGRGSGARRQEARSGTMSTRNSNMNKLRHFWTLITVLLVAGVMSSASAFAQHLHDQLLRPESEHVGTDAAGLAERRRRNLLPDTLGRAARRDRLGQRRTGHDLQRQRGLHQRISQLRGSLKSVAAVSPALLGYEDRNRRRLAQSEG